MDLKSFQRGVRAKAIAPARRSASRWRGLLRGLRGGGLVRGERGSSLIEFAVSAGVLMTFTFALMEICVAFYTDGMISEAAREGARYAVVRGSTCTTSSGGSCTVTTAQIKTFTQGLGYPNPGGGSLIATASFPDGDEVPGHRVLISVTYSFPIRFPLLRTTALPLTAQAEEVFVH
jgi:hypothetical protein